METITVEVREDFSMINRNWINWLQASRGTFSLKTIWFDWEGSKIGIIENIKGLPSQEPLVTYYFIIYNQATYVSEELMTWSPWTFMFWTHSGGESLGASQLVLGGHKRSKTIWLLHQDLDIVFTVVSYVFVDFTIIKTEGYLRASICWKLYKNLTHSSLSVDITFVSSD